MTASGKWPVLITIYTLGRGGCERDAAKIAVGLDRNLFEPHVGVFHGGGFRAAEVEAAGVPILELPVRSFLNSTFFAGARLLGDYIRKNGIALTHSFDVPLSVFTAPVARYYGVGAVVTSQLSYRDMYSRLYRNALRVSDRLSDRVVVNSNAVGESLIQEGVPERKIYLCYNGVQRDQFFPGKGKRPAGWEDCLIVGSICVMREEKRMEWLMRSFAELRDIAPRLRLLLMGGGPEVPKLEALRDELNLGDQCCLLEGQPDVVETMRAIDIYANCSRSESFPNALLEAMACGCCVVGSSVGGIPELISHGQNGFVFDSADRNDLTEKLRTAIQNSELRNSMRTEAAQTAHQRFSMEATLNRTEALYRTLLEGKSALC